MKRLWRIARWLLAALVAAFLLTVGSAVVLARTDWARDRLRQRIVERASSEQGIDLQIASLELELLPPLLRMQDLRVLGSDERDIFLAPEVEVALDAASLVRGRLLVQQLVLERPRLRLVVAQGKATNLPRRPGNAHQSKTGGSDPKRSMEIEQVRLVGGEVVVEAPEARGGPLSVAVEGLSAELALSSAGNKELTLECSGGTIEHDGRSIPIRALDASVVVVDGHALASKLRARVGEARLDLSSVDIELAPPHDLAIKGMLHIPLDWLEELPLETPPLQGLLQAGFDVSRRGKGKSLRAEGEIDIKGLAFRPPSKTESEEEAPFLLLGDLQATASFVDGILTFEKAALRRKKSNAAQLVLDGLEVTLEDPERGLRGRLLVQDLDIGELLTEAGRNEPGLKGVLSGSSKLSGHLTPPNLRLKELDIAVREISLTGEMPGEELKKLGDLHAQGEVGVQRDAVTFPGLKLDLDGAKLLVAGRVDLSEPRSIQVTLESEEPGIDLTPFGRIAGRSLTGLAQLHAEVGGTLAAPTAAGRLSISGLTTGGLSLRRLSTDFGYRDETLSLPGCQANFGRSIVRLAGGRIDFVGNEARRLRGTLELDPLELSDALRLARRVDAAKRVNGRLLGTIELDHDIARRHSRASIKGRLEEIKLGPAPLGDGEILGRYDGRVLSLERLDLENDESSLRIRGTAASKGDLDLDLVLERFRLGVLEGEPDTLATLDGTLDVRAQVNGTREEPHAQGTLALHDLRQGHKHLGSSTLDASFASGTLRLRGALFDGQIEIDEATVETSAGRRLRARGELRNLDLGRLVSRRDASTELRTAISGPFQLEIPLAARKQVVGVIGLQTVELQRGELRVALAPGEPLGIELGSGAVEVGAARFSIGKVGSPGGAKIRLDRLEVGLSDPWPFHIRGALAVDDLSALLDTDRVPTGLKVRLAGTFDGGGPLGEPAGLQGRASIRTLRLKRGKLGIAATAPIVLKLRGTRVVVPPARVQVLGPEGRGQSWLSLAGHVAPGGVLLDLDGDVRLAELQPLVDKVKGLSGKVRLSCRVAGSTSNPTLFGQARLTNGRALLSGGKFPLAEITARVSFNQRAIVLDHFRSEVNGGQLNARGRADLRGRAIGRYHFDVEARNVGVELKSRSRAVLNADIGFDSPEVKEALPLLSGDVEILRLRFEDQAGPRVRRNRVERPIKRLMKRLPGEPKVRLDLRLTDRGDIEMDNNMLRGKLSLSHRGRPLRVIGTDRQIALLGTVVIEPRSKLRVRNTEFDVESGTLNFFDREKVEARLHILATAKRRDWTISLTAGGTISSPKVQITSNPALSEEDIIMLLNIGLTTAEAGQRTRGGLATEVLWRATAGGKVAREVFPELDVFKVTSEYSPRTHRAGPRLRVGRPFADRWRIDASRGLTIQRDFEAVLSYELNEIFSFQGTYERDPDNFAGDVGAEVGIRHEFGRKRHR